MVMCTLWKICLVFCTSFPLCAQFLLVPLSDVTARFYFLPFCYILFCAIAPSEQLRCWPERIAWLLLFSCSLVTVFEKPKTFRVFVTGKQPMQCFKRDIKQCLLIATNFSCYRIFQFFFGFTLKSMDVFHRQHKNSKANFSRYFIIITIKCGAFSNSTILLSKVVNNHFHSNRYTFRLLAFWNAFIGIFIRESTRQFFVTKSSIWVEKI